METRIYLNRNKTSVLPLANQKELNSFIYRTLGNNNKWHDAFSDYAISSIQGVKYDQNKKCLNIVTDRPYIVLTTLNDEFRSTLLSNLEKKEYNYFGMTFDSYRTRELTIPQYHDYSVIQTISPILLKDNDKKITYRDDNFITKLNEQCKAKIRHCVQKCGMEISLDDFCILPYNMRVNQENFNNPFHALKHKIVYVGDVYNPCTFGRFVIYGDPIARLALCNLGIGNSTGSGFGSVKILN